MKHKNELDRLIRNLYLIKNTNLNNILETDKLAITRTTNFIEALINKIDPRKPGPYVSQQQANFKVANDKNIQGASKEIYLKNLPISIGKVEGFKEDGKGRKTKAQLDVLISPSDFSELLRLSNSLPITNEQGLEIKGNINLFQLMEEVVQKVGKKSLNIQQDKKILTSQENEQAITHGQQKVELSLKEEIIKLREAVQETIKNPTNNEEFNKTSKEILYLINNINSHQPSRLQAARNKILSSGGSPNAKNTKIEEFFLEQHEWDKFQELRERLQKIKEPREKLDEMKNFYDVINSLDKNIILRAMQEKQKAQQASNQKAQEIIRSKFLYLDNAGDFSDGLQNLFEELKNKEEKGQKELIEASKNILSKSIAVNKNYFRNTNNSSELDLQYKMLLIDHADNISQNIKEALVLYAGSNNNNQIDILSEELANKFKNISNLIRQNESVLQKETSKYSPSLETIPEDSIPKLSPTIVHSSTELFAKLENSFNELEQFTDKILIDAGKSYVQQANINLKSNNISRSSSVDSGIGSSQEELSTTFGKSGSTNLIEALDLAQAKILSNSNTTKDKLTATKELQKSIQQKEVSNERLTQEEIDNIYKTLGIFEEIKEYEKSENSRDPRLLNKNYYKLIDPREERRSDDIALEWDDTGMLPPSQNSAVLDKFKKAVDDYISELQNEKLSIDTSPKQVNIDNVLPKIRNLFNDELAKDTSPKHVNIDNVLPKIRTLFNDELAKDTSLKQVNIDNVLPKIRTLFNDELAKDTSPKHVNIDNVLPKIRTLFNDELAIDTSPMKEAIPTPPALSWNTHPIFGDTIKFLKRFKEEIDKFPQDYTTASTIPLYLSNVNRNLGRSEFLASMVSTSQKDERINDILDKLQKISTNCSKISNSDDKFNKEIKESFVEINTTLKNIIEYKGPEIEYLNSNIEKVQKNLSRLESFTYELSKNTSPKHTKQSTQEQPKISTGAVTGIKDRIAKFEADSDSKIKKYWTEEKKQTVEKQHKNTQSDYITPKKNFEFENRGKEIKENSTKNLINKFEKGFDSKITRYWTSPEEWDKWEEEKQKGTGKENELIRPRTKFLIEHSKHAKSKDNAPKRQTKSYIEASEDTHIKEGNTKSLKDKFENLAKEAKQIGTQAQQSSKSSSSPSIKPTGRSKDGRVI